MRLCLFILLFAAALVVAAVDQPRHPLDPLTATEIESAAKIVKASGRMAADALFSTIILDEPSKEDVRRFAPGAPIKRLAFVVVYDWRGDRTSEAIVDLGGRSVVSWKDVPGAQPPSDPERRD